MTSSTATLIIALRFLDAEASLPRRFWPGSLQRGDECTALTLSSRWLESPRTGARGASYAAFAAAAAPRPRVEHLLAQEPALLLLAVLGGALPAAAAGVFLEETGTGGEPEQHFLAALPPAPAPRTASSCAI